MNAERKIEIIKPFEDAFELMKKILFQPFDLKKWFIIGFAAWLSHIGSGGFNFRYSGGSDWQNTPWLQNISDTLHQIPVWIIVSGLIALIVLILALAILFVWLRARGLFMFIDCIAKNRGAVVEPWREFQEQGNSYFLFALAVGLIMLVIGGLTALPFLLPLIKNATFPALDWFLIGSMASWAVVFALLIFAWAVISHFMVVIMYRRRCLAVEAFRVATALLVSYPGEITLYCLFWIALAIGAAIAGCVMILATCCIALLPYIGTVIMLPIFVCLRAFGLCFIRQFGAEYDVWAALPSSTTEPPPLPS